MGGGWHRRQVPTCQSAASFMASLQVGLQARAALSMQLHGEKIPQHDRASMQCHQCEIDRSGGLLPCPARCSTCEDPNCLASQRPEHRTHRAGGLGGRDKLSLYQAGARWRTLSGKGKSKVASLPAVYYGAPVALCAWVCTLVWNFQNGCPFAALFLQNISIKGAPSPRL